MNAAPAGSLLHFLQQVPDPRGREGQRHPCAALLAVIVCALLCGHRGFDAIAQWIALQDLSLWHRLGGTRKPPCAGAFRYLLLRIDPAALEAALWRWVTEGLELDLSPDVPDVPDDSDGLAAVCLDGKSLRGSFGRHGRAARVLAALDRQTGCVLSQTPVHETANEAKTALAFLEGLVLRGRVVVADAAFCQREVCRKVLDSGGEYLVIVKDNQPALKRAIETEFAADEAAFSPLLAAQAC